VQRIRSRRRDLERTLVKAGRSYLLSLTSDNPRQAWLDEERDLLMGGYRTRCVLPEQADAIYFRSEVQAPRTR
jgi:hypothetical protein